VAQRSSMLGFPFVKYSLRKLVVDAQLRALTNPTRREILRCLSSGERSAGEISRRFRQTRPAISQHLAQLCDAGLLTVRRRAQSRLYSIDAEAVDSLRVKFNEFWDDALPRLKRVIEADLKRRGK